MTIKEALLEARELAEETNVGVGEGFVDHKIIVMIAELLLKYGKEE